MGYCGDVVVVKVELFGVEVGVVNGEFVIECCDLEIDVFVCVGLIG